jgi:dihydroorotate dehydrogenase electron transfer subunit
VNIKLDGLFLRRPISVCDVTEDCLTIIYKAVGKGTAQMAQMKAGTLDVLTGLGNGYDLSLSGDHPVLLGGGVGVPPMYLLARKLLAEGKNRRGQGCSSQRAHQGGRCNEVFAPEAKQTIPRR